MVGCLLNFFSATISSPRALPFGVTANRVGSYGSKAGVQLTEERLPFLKVQHWRKLPAAPHAAAIQRPKRWENLFLSALDVSYHKQVGIIVLALQSRTEANGADDDVWVLLLVRVVGVRVLNSILEFLAAFLAHVDWLSLGDCNRSVSNQNLLGWVTFRTTNRRRHRADLLCRPHGSRGQKEIVKEICA